MRAIAKAICFLLVLAQFLHVEGDEQADLATIIQGDAEFANSLYYSFSKRTCKDIIFSPFSIRASLSLLMMGAGNETTKRLARVSRMPNNKETVSKAVFKILKKLNENPDINIINHIFVTTPFKLKKEFEEIAKSKFFARIQKVDISESTSDNKGTKKPASSLLDPKYDKSSFSKPDFVLTNTIDFKGTWLQGSNLEITSPQPFTVSNSLTFLTKMSAFEGSYNFSSVKELGADVLEIPFKHDKYPRVVLVVILPFHICGLHSVEENLHKSNLTKILTMSKPLRNLTIVLPEISLDIQMILDQSSVYRDEVDFSNLTDSAMPNGKVIHRVVMKVGSKGVDAAAKVQQRVRKKSHHKTKRETKPKRTLVILNHPFIYVVRSENMTLLVMGRYTGTKNVKKQQNNRKCF